jgi:hypothetical protein
LLVAGHREHRGQNQTKKPATGNEKPETRKWQIHYSGQKKLNQFLRREVMITMAVKG